MELKVESQRLKAEGRRSKVKGRRLDVRGGSAVVRAANGQKGFTIIELLIATTVFSLVLLMATAGILEITRMYYRGTVQARTQEAARSALDEIAESIRYGVSTVSAPTFPAAATPPVTKINASMVGPNVDTSAFCVGNRRYSFAIDRQRVSDSPDPTNKEKHHVLWVDTVPSCVAGDPEVLSVADPSGGTGGRELMPENMRLTHLRVTSLSVSTVQIDLGVAYGNHAFLEDDGRGSQICSPSANRTAFCAVSNLSVTVNRRLFGTDSGRAGPLGVVPPELLYKVERIEEYA